MSGFESGILLAIAMIVYAIWRTVARHTALAAATEAATQQFGARDRELPHSALRTSAAACARRAGCAQRRASSRTRRKMVDEDPIV